MAEAKKENSSKTAEETEEVIGTHSLKPARQQAKDRKRVGRGHGSGTGRRQAVVTRARVHVPVASPVPHTKVVRHRFTCACASCVDRPRRLQCRSSRSVRRRSR